MPWFKVDDNLAFHQKTLRAGNAAMGLWVRAGSWCAQQLSDGYVPTDIARTMGTAAEAKKLVAANLWLDVDGGYQFWQWSEEGRQPTRSEVEERRKATRERQRRAREKSLGVTPSVTRDTTRDDTRESQRDNPVTDAVSHAAPDPTRPDPTQKDTTPSESLARTRGTRIPDDWTPDRDLIDQMRTEGIPDELARRELPRFRDYWTGVAGAKGVKLDWPATWRNWLRKANDERPATPPNGRPPGVGNASIKAQGWRDIDEPPTDQLTLEGRTA